MSLLEPNASPATESTRPIPLTLDADERADLTADVVAAVDCFLNGLDHAPAWHGPPDRELIDDLLSRPPEHGAHDACRTSRTVACTAPRSAASSEQR